MLPYDKALYVFFVYTNYLSQLTIWMAIILSSLTLPATYKKRFIGMKNLMQKEFSAYHLLPEKTFFCTNLTKLLSSLIF